MHLKKIVQGGSFTIGAWQIQARGEGLDVNLNEYVTKLFSKNLSYFIQIYFKVFWDLWCNLGRVYYACW
jgi:hypothetical protein